MSDDRAEGRGRLGSIDQLPDEAEPDVLWANEQLRDRKMPSKAILAEFNARLADRGIGPISKSAWGRFAIRKAVQFRKLDEMRRISSEIVGSLGTDGADQVTGMVAEMLKMRLFELLENAESGAKETMEMARALQSAVSAQKTSTEHRRKLEEVRAKVETAIDKASETSTGTDAAEVLRRIREDVYGIFAR